MKCSLVSKITQNYTPDFQMHLKSLCRGQENNFARSPAKIYLRNAFLFTPISSKICKIQFSLSPMECSWSYEYLSERKPKLQPLKNIFHSPNGLVFVQDIEKSVIHRQTSCQLTHRFCHKQRHTCESTCHKNYVEPIIDDPYYHMEKSNKALTRTS